MSLIKEIEEQWIPEAIRFGEDAESGSIVDQITSEPVTSTNIYGEQRFASADGARIAISRKPFGRPSEIWVCDLRSMRLCKAVVGDAVGATSPKDSVYYTTKEGGVSRLMCLNLADLTIVELHDFGQSQLPRVGAVSPDRRYFVGGPFDVRENVYSLHRIDLESGESDVLCEVEDMFNPHLQFGPSGTEFIIQINRGGQTANTGKKVANVGPLGATLAVGDVVTGEVTAMPIGRPHTSPISGHEAWIGDTGGILFSAAYYKVSVSSFVTLKTSEEIGGDDVPPALYSASPGDTEATLVASGLLFNHLAVSDDGDYFIADDHVDSSVYIGRIGTGKYRKLCDSHTRQGVCQYSHVHPYMTPDNKYVIFNSIVTGSAQVYAASVPDGFLDSI